MRITFTLLVAVLPTLALAAEPDVPGYDSQTRRVIERAFERYQRLKSYQDTLVTEVEFDVEGDVPGLTPPPQQTLKLAFARPNRLAFEAPEFSVHCDGRKLWEHINPWGQYVESPAPSPIEFSKLSLSQLGALDDIAHPLVLLLTQPAPSLDAFGKVVRLTGVAPDPLKDRRGQRVKGLIQVSNMRGRQLEMPFEVWFDDETGLIGEIGYDYQPVLQESLSQHPGKPTVRRFFRRSRVTNVTIDDEVPDERFKFKPDSGDEKVPALRPPSPEQLQQKLVGRPAPDFSGEDIDGRKLSLSDLKGRVVVLDFWATWCGPCLMAMPALQKVADKYADKPVTILGVNTDMSGQQRRVADVLKAKGITFRQFMDPGGQAAQKYFVSGIPLKVLIDKQGVVQAFHVGFSYDEVQVLSGMIDALLAGQNLFSGSSAGH